MDNNELFPPAGNETPAAAAPAAPADTTTPA